MTIILLTFGILSLYDGQDVATLRVHTPFCPQSILISLRTESVQSIQLRLLSSMLFFRSMLFYIKFRVANIHAEMTSRLIVMLCGPSLRIAGIKIRPIVRLLPLFCSVSEA